MAETKFTPGPWNTVHGVYTPEDNYFSMIAASEGGVASVWNKEDAYLIAAAPELYEALEGAIGALEYSVDCARDDGDNSDIDFAQSKLDAALNALAKARGEANG
jgi:hypothetical protein